jgi:hypothetical protein
MLPYIIMLVEKCNLGISDAFLGGDRGDAAYNLEMVGALLLGSVGFLAHAIGLPAVKGRGWRWVAPKCIFLAVCWAIGIASLCLVR